MKVVPYTYDDEVEVRYAGDWAIGHIVACSAVERGQLADTYNVVIRTPDGDHVMRQCDSGGEGAHIRPAGTTVPLVLFPGGW